MMLPNKFIKDYRKLYRLIKDGTTFTAFDTETTGLSAENCRIIEIGAIQFNKTGILGQFNTLINPEQKIPFESSRINHITDNMVKDSPKIREILPEFLNFLGDSTIIGHNVNFDLRFLKAEMERNGLKPIENYTIDTLNLCRWTFPDFEKYNQPFMADYFKININDAHRAYDDAFICGQIFLNCVKFSADRQKI